MNGTARLPLWEFQERFFDCVRRRSLKTANEKQNRRTPLRWYESGRASKGTIVLEAQTLKEARDDPRRSGPTPGILLHDGAGFNRTFFESGAGDQRTEGPAPLVAGIFRAGGGGGGSLQFLAGL